jgi:hypothetical protein
MCTFGTVTLAVSGKGLNSTNALKNWAKTTAKINVHQATQPDEITSPWCRPDQGHVGGSDIAALGKTAGETPGDPRRRALPHGQGLADAHPPCTLSCTEGELF